MKPQDHTSKIAQIKIKVQKLLYLHRGEIEKNRRLEAECSGLKSRVERQELALRQLDEKIKILMLANSMEPSDESRKQIRTKLNGLIREVDKCIALLNA